MINQNYQIMFYHITHINNKNIYITISTSTGFQELFGLMLTFTGKWMEWNGMDWKSSEVIQCASFTLQLNFVGLLGSWYS